MSVAADRDVLEPRQSIVRSAVIALVLYSAAFIGLSVGGSKRSGVVVVVAALFLLAAASLLQLTLSRARAKKLLSRRVLLWGPVAIMAAGAALGLYWWLGTQIGIPTGGAGFCGLCAGFLGAGQALAEVRSRAGGAPWRGAIVIAASAGLFAAGLILCLEASAAWLAIAGLALLLAPVGLTLLTEDVLNKRLKVLRVGAVLGPILALTGTLLLSKWTGISSSLAYALVAVLFVLVGAISSSTQADVLLVVTVVALVWAATPREVAPDDTVAVKRDQPTLVSLGDSYMSGEGARTFFEGTNESGRNECRRSPKAYAHLVVERATSPLRRLAFYACSGAVAANVHELAQWPGEPIDATPEAGAEQLDQLASLLRRPGADVRLVIVSIGGNDAGFATIGAACLAPGSCVERGQTWLDRLEKVAARVRDAYREIRAVVGTEVPVLAVPYPVPIKDEPCRYSLLVGDEHRFLHGFVQQLNGVVSRAAREAGFYYLTGMADAFTGRLRICDGPQDKIGVNFIALRSVDGVVDQALNPVNWIHNSLHPNERGHAVMAGVLNEWLRSHPDPTAKPTPRDEPQSINQASLPEVMGSTHISYCGGPGSAPDYCDRSDPEWAVTQVALTVRDGAIPGLLVVIGWWLLWLSVLARTRPAYRGLGDRVALRLLGARFHQLGSRPDLPRA